MFSYYYSHLNADFFLDIVKMQGAETDFLKLFKSKEFKAHLACLKKDKKIEAKVKLLEDNFKKLQLQVKQKDKLREEPYDVLTSVTLSIEILSNVRDILVIQSDDDYLDSSVESCPETHKSVSKLADHTAVSNINQLLTRMSKVKKEAAKRKKTKSQSKAQA